MKPNLKILLSYLICSIFLFSYSKCESDENFKIQWVDTLEGDFSFKDHWQYPEGIWHNEFGQLYNGNYSTEISERMLDSNSKILDDSLDSYYKIFDTTHIFQSIVSDGWCYEFRKPFDIKAHEEENKIVKCSTEISISGHSCLYIEIDGDFFRTEIIYYSVVSSKGRPKFKCTDGYLKVAKKEWQNGILKAEFKFNFHNHLDTEKKIFWNGRIYKVIEKN